MKFIFTACDLGLHSIYQFIHQDDKTAVHSKDNLKILQLNAVKLIFLQGDKKN